MASEIKVDTISEKTSANGVTIDGVNIKDSALATAGSVPLTTIDIDGGTDIGAAIVDADLFIIDDGAGGTNRKVAASRIKTYAGGSVTAINNATANELVTIGSTTTELDAESGLTYTDGALVIGGTTPSLTIGDAGAEDAKIVFDGNAQDFHIGLDDTADDLVIGLGSTLGTTTHMAFDEAGTVTMPLQPAFMIYKSSAQDDINLNTTITWETERFDVNGDFASNTFTAPVTGKYLMAVHIRWDDIPADGEYTCLNVITSNYSYQYVGMVAHTGFDATQLYHSSSFTGVVDMDASDTCYVQHQGQTSTVDVSVSSYFSGMLIG